MKKSILLFASLFMLFFISCNDDDPSTKSTFSIQQKQLLKKSTINNKLMTIVSSNGTFTFTNAMIGISKIEFETEFEMDDIDIEEEIEYNGSFQFDVLNGTSSPSIPTIDLEAGVYHELEFNVDNVLASGNSIEIAGNYNDGNTIYTFEFTSTMDEEFEIENENGINLNVNETVYFVLFLQLESLFNGVDFSSASIDDDGIIRINSDSNSEIASHIESNLEDIMEFEDGDDH